MSRVGVGLCPLCGRSVSADYRGLIGAVPEAHVTLAIGADERVVVPICTQCAPTLTRSDIWNALHNACS